MRKERDPKAKKSEELAALWGLELELEESSTASKMERSERLLQEGADPSWMDPKRGRSAFHMCVAAGELRAALKMMEAGADVERPTADGESPMELAIRRAPWKQAPKLVEALIQKGARLDPEQGGEGTWLGVAAKKDEPELMRAILSGLSPSQRKAALDQVAPWCAQKGAESALMWALEQGAAPTGEWKNGNGKMERFDALLIAMEKMMIDPERWDRLIKLRGPLEAKSVIWAAQKVGDELGRFELGAGAGGERRVQAVIEWMLRSASGPEKEWEAMEAALESAKARREIESKRSRWRAPVSQTERALQERARALKEKLALSQEREGLARSPASKPSMRM